MVKRAGSLLDNRNGLKRAVLFEKPEALKRADVVETTVLRKRAAGRKTADSD